MLHTRRAIRLTRPELALVAVTAVWGATFLVVHLAVHATGPMFFVAVRFLTAGLLSAVVFRRSLRGLTRREIASGASIGVTMFAGYALQTWALQHTTASAAAFLTALYVPLVPLLAWACFRVIPRPPVLAGVALAFLGLVLLAGPGRAGPGLGPGEVATVLGAVAIAAEVLLISHFAGSVDVGRVTVVQLLVTGALALLAMAPAGEALPAFSWVWLCAGIGLGLASCLIQVTMNWAQRTVSPTRATIIYAGEPVWGGVFGRLAGERLPALALLGAMLVVAGVLVSELRPRRPGEGQTTAVTHWTDGGSGDDLQTVTSGSSGPSRPRRPTDEGSGQSSSGVPPGCRGSR